MLHFSTSGNTGTSDLPDMYALIPWACDPRASGELLVPISQLLLILQKMPHEDRQLATCTTKLQAIAIHS